MQEEPLLLTILAASPDSYVSGEEISARLGVSRTAVWKHINLLRRQGYEIVGTARRGYRLLSRPDLLYPWEVRRGLKAEVFGREFVYLQETDSTNNVARRLAQEGAPEGTVVAAESQTAGRGRWGRSWFSPRQLGLWFSVVLRPRLAPTSLPWLALMAGAAVARALEETTGLRPGIKWPNDLLLGGRKFCGILLEMEGSPEEISFLVLGIGVNVNQQEHDFPPELLGQATSLRVALGQEVARLPLLRRLLEVLEEEYCWGCRRGWERARSLWLRYEVTLGRMLRLRTGGGEVLGRALDLGEDGALLVQGADGRVHRFYAGEVELCREE